MDQLYWICPSIIALLTVYLVIAHQRRKLRFLSSEIVAPLRDFAFKHQLRFQERQELENELGREHVLAGNYHGRPLALRYRDGISEANTVIDLFAQQPLGNSLKIEHSATARGTDTDVSAYPDFELWFKVSGNNAIMTNDAMRKLMMLALTPETGTAQINISKKGRVRLRTAKPLALDQLDIVLTMLEALAEQVEAQAVDIAQIKETLSAEDDKSLDSVQNEADEFSEQQNHDNHN